MQVPKCWGIIRRLEIAHLIYKGLNMSQKILKIFICMMLCSALTGLAFAETMLFDTEKGWQETADQNDSAMFSGIAQFKQLVSQNKPDEAQKAANELNSSFPQLKEQGFDDFVKAEIFYAKRNYLKAGKEYDNFLDNWPNSKLYEAGLERQYDLATAFLAGQKIRRLLILRLTAYEEAATMLEKIADRAGDAAISKRALFTLAENYEKRKKFLDAYQVWADIASRWPTGETGKLALRGMARSLHSSYRGPKFSATNLNSAKSYLNTFSQKYPVEAEEINVNASLDLIEQQKAFKDYENARYYKKTENAVAAEIYYDSVIDNWPDSAAAQLSKNELRKLKAEGIKKKKNILIDWWFNPPEDKVALFKI